MSWVSVQTVENRYELYLWMEQQYGRRHERQCIDKKWTASSKCKGCCLHDFHPGFLTGEMIEQRHCEENDCIHYLPKLKKTNYLSVGKR